MRQNFFQRGVKNWP